MDEIKEKHNANPNNARLKPLLQVSAIDQAIVREIANNARQSRDFFASAKTMPMISKPILLFYSFEKLAEIAILNTFVKTEPTFAHGLAFDPKTSTVKVLNEGLFAKLHDCYSSNPTFCGKRYVFKLDNLINSAPIDKSELFRYGEIFDGIPVREETTQSDVKMGEPDREFLFIFALSILARYHVHEWSDIIEGKNDTRILKIRRYTHFYSNILSELDT